MLALFAAMLAPFPPAQLASCAYDRAAMLALDQTAFDQDMDGGWRALANAGCDAEAADLIRAYREVRPPEYPEILFWHEGQLRANAGQYDQAIILFERSRKSLDDDGFGWNLYVDGSIAFLRGNRSALDAAHALLAKLPKPTGFDPRGPDGKPFVIEWPPNLAVLDRFRRCWGQSYKLAYGCPPASSTGS